MFARTNVLVASPYQGVLAVDLLVPCLTYLLLFLFIRTIWCSSFSPLLNNDAHCRASGRSVILVTRLKRIATMLFAILLHSFLLACMNCVAADPHNHNHKHKHEARHDDTQQQQQGHEKRQWGGPETPGIYDYIFVGSGAGGGPAACRLARAGYSVLLIEAGDDQGHRLETTVPTWHLQAAEVPEQKWVRRATICAE